MEGKRGRGKGKMGVGKNGSREKWKGKEARGEGKEGMGKNHK